MKRIVAIGALILGSAPVAPSVVGAPQEERAYLGVYLSDLSEPVRTALGLGEDEGVLVEQVADDGPAAKAGLKEGDVIVAFDGDPITGSGGLHRRLDRARPDQEVPIVALRKGQRQTLNVKLGSRPRSAWRLLDGSTLPSLDGIPLFATPPAPPRAPRAPGAPTPPGTPAPPALASPRSLGQLMRWDSGVTLGVRVQDLTGQLADYFQVSRGALVTWVSAGSAAAAAGIKAGDVIVALAGQPVQGEEDLRTILADLDAGKETNVTLSRRGSETKVTVKLEEP
jgi:serine protease Do